MSRTPSRVQREKYSVGACPPPNARQQPASYIRTGVRTETNLTVGAPLVGALGGDPANHNRPANSLRRPLHSSFVRKCAYAAFERAVEPLHSAISSFRPLNSSFPRRRESRGEGWHQPHPNTSNDQASFSYLGVPAAAGMSDCYESMSRTTIRDRLPPLISSFQRKLESRRGGEGLRPPDDGKNPPVTPFSSSYADLSGPW